jgi:hypothetical protein
MRPEISSAGDVVDDRRRHEPRALQHLLHHARGLVPAAARRGGRDQAQLAQHRLRARRQREHERERQHAGADEGGAWNRQVPQGR